MLFRKKAWPILTVLTGATLEYYAYMLFAVMVSNPVFLDQFFPADSASFRILKGYLFFTICALCRPLGALFFGWIGDRYGRRQALFGSLMLMSGSCFLISIVPTYAQAGMYAVALLFLARVSQIISASGETNGAPIFLIEHFGITRAGFASGLAYFGTMAGSSLATLSGAIFQYGNTWRYAFVIGGFVGLIGLVIRMRLKESKEFSHTKSSDAEEGLDFEHKFSAYVVVWVISACCSAVFYYSAMFLPQYWLSSLGNPADITHTHMISVIQTCMVFLYACVLLLSGFVSDYISLFKIMKTGGFLLILSVSSFLYSISAATKIDDYMIIISYIFIMSSLAIFAGPSHSFMYRFFPPRLRYRSVSLCYSLATATVGAGSMPAALALYQHGWNTAWWIMPIIVAAYFSICKAEKMWNKITMNINKNK